MEIPKLPANPYVGLRPFNEAESLLFFGRREQTIELLQRLHTHHFIAVTGSSGCGKSSLIRAGLIPKLKAGLLVEDRDQWRIATLKPGDAPLANLAAALLEAQGTSTQAAGQDAPALLSAIEETGVQALLQHLAPALADANLLLLVDQFEEIFQFAQFGDAAHADQREEAEDFVALLLALAAQSELPIYVVLTMRSDFIGDCDNFFGLPEAFNRSQYLVPRLTRAQRQQAIEGPAQLFGATLTPRLLDRVLNDVGEKDDQLPVLQHALLRTWEEWQSSGAPVIDLPHYEAERVGTINHALARDADRALAGLGKEELEITRRMFQALTGADARNRRVRRRAYLSELCAITGATTAQLDAIIHRFQDEGRSFLIRIPGRTPGDPLVDISHESLIRQWHTLGAWMESEAKSRDMYRRLADAAQRYQRGEARLWSNPELGLALAWRKAEHPNATWAAHHEPGTDFAATLNFLDRSRRGRRLRLLTILLPLALLVYLLYHYQFELRVQQADERTALASRQLTQASLVEVKEGVDQFTEGQRQEALANFNQAVQLAPDNVEAYYYRGNAYAQNGQTAQAAADFNRYLELGGTIEKRDKAQKFIAGIKQPTTTAVSAEADARCAALVEDMFDTDKGTRIAVTTNLILNWNNYPKLVPLVLAKAEAHLTNKSGTINALVVLRRADPQSLVKHQAQVNRLLAAIEANGPQTKQYADEVRAVLRNASQSSSAPVRAK